MDYIIKTLIVSEYRDMPGLHLTPAQAARLWDLQPRDCAAILEQLVTEGHLRRTSRGKYALANAPSSTYG